MVEFNRKPLEDVLALMPLALKNNQEIDYEAIRNGIKFLEENGVNGFIQFGCMGQMHAVSENEFNKITDVCVETADKAVVVISSTAPNTGEAIRRAKYAENAGADGSMLALPYAFTPTAEQAVEHYKMVDEAIDGDMAILVYNYPPLTGFNITSSMWENELFKIESLKAIKESNFSIEHRDDILYAISDQVNVFSGIESLFWHDSLLGGKGTIGILTWVAPKLLVKFVDECRRGNHLKPWTVEVNKNLVKAFSGMLSLGVPLISYEGAILNALVEIGGNKAGPPKMPYTPLPVDAQKRLEVLKEATESVKKSIKGNMPEVQIKIKPKDKNENKKENYDESTSELKV